MQLSYNDIETLLDALRLGASRHLSIAKATPSVARKHELRAHHMERLTERLLNQKVLLAGGKRGRTV